MPFVEDIEVESVHHCPACGTGGESLYLGLRDHTFGAPGTWQMSCCPSCTLTWLDPRPTVADIGKVYRTYYTHGVADAGTVFQTHVRGLNLTRRLLASVTGSVRRIQDAILAVRFGYRALSKGSFDAILVWTLGYLPGMSQGASMQVLGLHARERGRVLDIGCGNGVFLARLRALGWETVGHEMDPIAAHFARQNFGLDVREGPLAEAGFKPETFDIVTLSHVIEHVHDPEGLVRQCRALLKPGGKLIILTPNSDGLCHRYFRESWRGLEPPRHIHCFNPRTLRTCVERSDLRVERLETPTRMMRAIWYASRLIQRADCGGKMVNNLVDYLAAYAMQFIVIVIGRFSKNVGEEIMLIARR